MFLSSGELPLRMAEMQVIKTSGLLAARPAPPRAVVSNNSNIDLSLNCKLDCRC